VPQRQIFPAIRGVDIGNHPDWVWVAQQGCRRHDLTGLAIAALDYLEIEPGFSAPWRPAGDAPMPSMVVTGALAHRAHRQHARKRTGLPSICTVQAPHLGNAAAEFRSGHAEHIAQNPRAAAISAGASNDFSSPLIVKFAILKRSIYNSIRYWPARAVAVVSCRTGDPRNATAASRPKPTPHGKLGSSVPARWDAGYQNA